MQKPKVLFLIGTLQVGGAEKQLVELASRLDRDRFEPMVCSFTGGDLVPRLESVGIPVHVLNGSPPDRRHVIARARAFCHVVWSLWQIVRKERPTIVHGLLFWAYVLGAYIGRLSGVPVVIAGRRSLGLFKAHKPHYLVPERIADWMTDIFIANSEAVRLDTIRRENIRPENILVIRNGVDLSRFDIEPDEALAAALDITSRPRVIVVSNLRHYKGHDYFLDAWRDVVDRFPTAVAMLAGDGVLRPALEQQAEALGIRHTLRFLGVRHDVPALLALADVYVHPSLQEGFSNAVLEAMAAGKAIVATTVGGNTEAITDDVTGLLVPPRDSEALSVAMLRLLGDQDAARRMGESARQHVHARHEINAMVREYEQVYHRMLSTSRRGQRVSAD